MNANIRGLHDREGAIDRLALDGEGRNLTRRAAKDAHVHPVAEKLAVRRHGQDSGDKINAGWQVNSANACRRNAIESALDQGGIIVNAIPPPPVRPTLKLVTPEPVIA